VSYDDEAKWSRDKLREVTKAVEAVRVSACPYLQPTIDAIDDAVEGLGDQLGYADREHQSEVAELQGRIDKLEEELIALRDELEDDSGAGETTSG
jgi:hypothetical protein